MNNPNGKEMLRFERLDKGRNDWDRELNRYPERTIFQTSDWAAFVADTQNAEPVLAVLTDGHRTVGYFTGLIVQKFGLRILGSPFPGWTTNYMGFCLAQGFSRRMALDALTRFAFDDLHCVHLEIAERDLTVEELDGLGFEHTVQSTFEIDLTHSDDQLFARMSKSCRWCIRKSGRNGVTVQPAQDIEFAEDYYAQLVDVFAKQSLVPTYGVERVRKLIKYLYPTGMLLLVRAVDHDKRCIGTGIFPAMNGVMYFWGGASWRSYQHLLPNEAIQWYAMKYWKERGMRVYDMGGGGEYKRKYGGTEVQIPWFRKSKYLCVSRLRNLAQGVAKRRQILLGTWKRLAPLQRSTRPINH